MKKLIASLALIGFSLPIMAQDTISLNSGTLLDVSSVGEIQLMNGESKDNVWFAVDPAQISSSNEKQLSNCVLTAYVGLENGELQFNTHSLRCPSMTGDVFTAEEIAAELTASLSQVCTSSGNSCSQITFNSSSRYTVKLEEASSLVAAYNASREANRLRIEEQLNGGN
ncbi:hypothetical protein [Marinospirillum perlucidum]|uniref:hypothetical protein n=1 Tax=Marinospirillum perlucidum TaxID=1982602 RepID=UPI000DF3D7DB|nr:hypothetical protein [Marinospirillum perlucidum]